MENYTYAEFILSFYAYLLHYQKVDITENSCVRLATKFYEKIQACHTVKELRKVYLAYLFFILKNSPLNYSTFDRIESYDVCNCYHYALGLPCPSFFQTKYKELVKLDDNYYRFFIGNIGNIAGLNGDELNHKTLLEFLNADLETLKIKAYDSYINAPLKHNGIKIAIFDTPELNNERYDFHFVRQNNDGLWSSKIGYYDNNIYISDNPFLSVVSELENLCSAWDKYDYVKTLEIVKPK